MGWVVNATPRPLYPRWKTRYPLYRGLGVPQGRCGRVRKISPLPGFYSRTFLPVASRCTDWANNTEVINNNYWRLQELIFLFKLPTGTRKDFFEVYRQFGHATSESLVSAGKNFCLTQGSTRYCAYIKRRRYKFWTTVLCGPVYLSRYRGWLRAGRPGHRIPLGARFSEPFQIGPGTHSLLYNTYRISFSGVKQPGRGVNHPPLSSAEVKERVELYLTSPSGSSWPILGRALPLPFTTAVRFLYITFKERTRIRRVRTFVSSSLRASAQEILNGFLWNCAFYTNGRHFTFSPLNFLPSITNDLANSRSVRRKWPQMSVPKFDSRGNPRDR